MISRLIKDKGVLEYVEAARKVKQKFPQAQFQLLGPFWTQNLKSNTITEENVQGWVDEQIKDLGLELNPDFQRGHVWTEQQQIKYIEHLLRGGKTATTLYFNHPNWMGNFEGEFVCVDGLQRLTAIQKFMNNEIPAFDTYLDEFEDKDMLLRSIQITVNINNLWCRSSIIAINGAYTNLLQNGGFLVNNFNLIILILIFLLA
jgi:glycosyltransferase involved in cell wall biosynthesis